MTSMDKEGLIKRKAELEKEMEQLPIMFNHEVSIRQGKIDMINELLGEKKDADEAATEAVNNGKVKEEAVAA